VQEAERVFAELAEGGRIEMPVGPAFVAARFGMLTDRCGIAWMVNCD
jgi:PhnB protein